MSCATQHSRSFPLKPLERLRLTNTRPTSTYQSCRSIGPPSRSDPGVQRPFLLRSCPRMYSGTNEEGCCKAYRVRQSLAKAAYEFKGYPIGERRSKLQGRPTTVPAGATIIAWGVHSIGVFLLARPTGLRKSWIQLDHPLTVGRGKEAVQDVGQRHKCCVGYSGKDVKVGLSLPRKED